MAASETAAVGPWTRLVISARVALVVVLAAAAAGAVTWLSARPDLRWRADVTEAGRNTLDPALAELVEKLPEKATAEIFFRSMSGELAVVGAEVQQRMRELLFVAQNQFPDKLRVIDHDLRDLASAQSVMQEFDLTEVNVIVVHAGKQRAVLRLFLDIARVSPANPINQTPARLESFRGDDALGRALLRVSRGEPPRILFTTGHGERDPLSDEDKQLGALQRTLATDGFRVSWWDSSEEPEVPADCDVLAIVDPLERFSQEEVEAVRAYLDRGGRLFATPSSRREFFDGPGSVTDLLRGYGIQGFLGYIARPIRNAAGQLVDGSQECARLFVPSSRLESRHPITESLWRAKYTLEIPLSRGFRRGTPPENSVIRSIVRVPPGAWIDLPNAEDRYDWKVSQVEQSAEGLALSMAVAFPAEGAPDGGDGSERRSGRIVAFGSPDTLANGAYEQLRGIRELMLNTFNWLAEREYRLSVRPRDPDRRFVDIQTTNALAVVHRLVALALPGAFALAGIVLAWRRRR